MSSLYLQLTGTSSIKRRVGLSRYSETGVSMLRQGIPTKIVDKEATMPPKKVKILVPRGKGKASAMNEKSDSNLNSQKEDLKSKVKEDEEDIFRLPDSFSSDSENEDDATSIKPSVFKTGSNDLQPATKKTSNQNSKTKSAAKHAVTRNSARTKASTMKSSQSPKRKSQEAAPTSSAADIFGNLNPSKKAKLSYGSSQKKGPSSSQHSLPKSSQDKLKAGERFSVPDIDSSPEKSSSPRRNMILPSGDGLDSPTSSPEKSQVKNPKMTSILELKCSIDDSEEDEPPDVFMKNAMLDSPRTRFQPDLFEKTHIDRFNQPATQLQAFDFNELDDSGLLTQANDVLRDDEKLEMPTKSIWDVTSTDEQNLTQTQSLTKCPMCHAPVDPEVLKAAGVMSTRTQDTFCRTHRRKDAEEQWEIEGYPTIKWDTLPKHLLKHRRDIETWIEGAESHYRYRFSDSLSKGQDRNLRKAGSNLIPGYYGPRGARIISEFIMDNFTDLVKERAPKDRVMSKRGVTAYVQAVLVMEVAALLIMEDMDVDVERAREILTESVAAGELLCPEKRDKLSRKVLDTEDEDQGSDDELA